MTYRVILAESAFLDLEEAKAFIGKDNPSAAKEYVRRILNRLEMLKTSPYGGVRISNSLFDYAKARYLVCGNHVAIYQVNEDAKCVYVLRVLSHFRDWRNLVCKEALQNRRVIAESERLQIVRMDVSMYYEVYVNSLDEDNRNYLPDEVFASLEEASSKVDGAIKAYESEDGPFLYAVVRRGDGANLGHVQLVKGEEGYEIGYHIAKAHTGKGYASEAVRLLLGFLGEHSDLKRVLGIALYSNKASRRVLEKCGFETFYEGIGLYQGRKRKIVKAVKNL